MKVPPRYSNSLNNQVCRLRKAFYGLKQSLELVLVGFHLP